MTWASFYDKEEAWNFQVDFSEKTFIVRSLILACVKDH